ncbi:MAG: type II secretion system protein [Deltaproteobacteria bacterium]|nr:type II secretion system protein [Deltaproteobacteria bacterium]
MQGTGCAGRSFFRREAGLTLIELLVTVTIIAILASVVMPLARTTVKRSKEAELRESLRGMRNAIDAYKQAWDDGKIKKNIGDSGYPPSLDALVEGVEDVTSPKSAKLRFLRRIPRDPMNPDEGLGPKDTWGLRSYASEPDEPQEGDDVFDVFSKSENSALDGTKYRDW